MSRNFNTQPRFSPAGVTTAAVLITILAMAVSTLVPSEAPMSGDFATSSATQLVQAHHATPTRNG